MSMNNNLNCYEAKQFSIADYLEKEGYLPVRKDNNGNLWYLSPFRTEKEPSFRINVKMNAWYDYATKEGGTIIDLGIKYHGCSVEEFLKILSNKKQHIRITKDIPDNYKPESSLKVSSINPLANNALLNYLKSRGISSDISKKYCKEVYYEIDSKKYFAIGFPNRSGGFELRNEFYKGCISPKDFTIISSNNNTVVCLFEGFISFLSFFMLKIDVPIKTDYIIMNSAALYQKVVSELIRYEFIYVFGDNDSTGRTATTGIQRELGMTKTLDMARKIYPNHNDLNDYLMDLNRGLDRNKSQGLSM
jgi:hypothetical protein